MPTLKQKTINGMLWSVGERLSMQVALMITSIIMARLLEPADFGLLSMLTIFTAIAQSIMDSGFGSALIQKKEVTQSDASSVFYFNLFIGCVLAGSMVFISPYIANFYNQPILAPITRILSINLVINAFSLVQSSLLSKELNFSTQFKVSLVAVTVSGVFGISLAYFGFGVWSLVVQLLSRHLLSTILLWIFNSWRPSFIFSIKSLKTMFSFGSWLLISGLIESIFRNVYQTFIGRLFSASELGFYSKAQTLEIAATNATSSSLSRVTYASLSPYQDDNKILKSSYRKTIKLSMFLHFPLMIGLIFIADPLIRFLLTNRWAPSIPFFQLLCVTGLFVPLDYFNKNILKVKGKTDITFKLQIFRKIVTAIAVVITYRWGILAMIYGQIGTALINFIINSHYSNTMIGYSRLDQIKDILPSFISSLVMGICIYFVGLIHIDSLFIDLILRLISGPLCYFTINSLIKSSELKEIKQLSVDTIKLLLKKY